MSPCLRGGLLLRSSWFVLLLGVVLLLSACATIRPTKAPLDTRWYRQGDTTNRTLLVLLPGRGDTVDRFEEEGFVTAVRDAGICADLVVADAHLGYYYAEQVVPRLKDDIIRPAQAAGYERIWLVGISLGGFGAIWYDGEHPGDVTGIILLAPFLGYQEIIDEVAAAGGVRQWDSGPATRQYQREIWRMVKGYTAPERSRGRVYLAYGLSDKFARPDSMFAAVLPPAQVVTATGGHDWSTWRGLWKTILNTPAFRHE